MATQENLITTIQNIKRIYQKTEELLHCRTEALVVDLINIEECVNLLFSTAPIKEGDRVKLLITPEINDEVEWGWKEAKHFLIEGAIGVAKTVYKYKGDKQLRVGVIFDNDSYYSTYEKRYIPLEEGRRGLYSFLIDQLQKID